MAIDLLKPSQIYGLAGFLIFFVLGGGIIVALIHEACTNPHAVSRRMRIRRNRRLASNRKRRLARQYR